MSKNKSKNQSESIQPPNRYPIFDEEFQEHLGWWYKTNKSKVKKIFELVSDTMAHPFEGLGKPEPLKYLAPDLWSRRIDLEHRLVYRVTSDRIDFLACRYHYGVPTDIVQS